jgi:hypothetical protein
MRVIRDTDKEETELFATDRFEWERIVRRVQMPGTTKLLALVLATYADKDGTRVRPGVERLALVMCCNEKTVDRAFKTLRHLGLVKLTKRGNRHAKEADEYRLTIPSTLLSQPMLNPEETELSGGHE